MQIGRETGERFGDKGCPLGAQFEDLWGARKLCYEKSIISSYEKTTRIDGHMFFLCEKHFIYLETSLLVLS